jgi:hypothetical protein
MGSTALALTDMETEAKGLDTRCIWVVWGESAGVGLEAEAPNV